jgi:hypothetical protein
MELAYTIMNLIHLNNIAVQNFYSIGSIRSNLVDGLNEMCRFNWIASIHNDSARVVTVGYVAMSHISAIRLVPKMQHQRRVTTLMLNGSPFRDRRRFYSQQSFLSRSFESTRIAPTCNPKVGKPTIASYLAYSKLKSTWRCEQTNPAISNIQTQSPPCLLSRPTMANSSGNIVGCLQRSASFEVQIS